MKRSICLPFLTIAVALSSVSSLAQTNDKAYRDARIYGGFWSSPLRGGSEPGNVLLQQTDPGSPGLTVDPRTGHPECFGSWDDDTGAHRAYIGAWSAWPVYAADPDYFQFRVEHSGPVSYARGWLMTKGLSHTTGSDGLPLPTGEFIRKDTFKFSSTLPAGTVLRVRVTLSLSMFSDIWVYFLGGPPPEARQAYASADHYAESHVWVTSPTFARSENL